MRRVIVTGGGRGSGRAMVLALAKQGHDVLAAGHLAQDEEELMSLARSAQVESKVEYALVDLRTSAGCDDLVAQATRHHAQVDALINNAGLTLTFVDAGMYTRKNPRRFFESSDEVIRGIYETNCMAAEMLSARVAPGMLQAGWGRIINVTTMYPTMKRTGFCPYGASKAALEMSTMVWAEELIGTGVTVNILNPGGGANTLGIAPEMREASAQGQIPKLVEPEEMGAPACWLISDASNGISGMRYDANTWDPKLEPAKAAAQCGRPAGLKLLADL